MTPEFLVNYIAFNPTNDEVRSSLKQIFPSVLGIRIGSRMSEETLGRVMNKIKEAYQIDPARASAIVAEHSDALKSGNVRDFAIKYASTNV